MTFVDHFKDAKPENLMLEVAFGTHVITGDLAKSIVTGSSPTHVVNVQHLLGEAYGKGWQGPLGVWFRGTVRDSSKYKFHPGRQTPTRVIKNYTVDHTTDTLTSAAHGYNNDEMVIFLPGDIPPEITAGSIHFIVNKTTNTFQVSKTLAGSVLGLSANGSGTRQLYKNDASQGIDLIFDQDTPHSNTAWIRVECPNGSEVGIPEFDTKENPPTGLTLICQCQLGETYDDGGFVVDPDVLLINPADVLAFGCMEIRRFENSRIEWATLDVLRQACAVTEIPDYTTLPQGVGLTGKYYDGNAFNTFKSQRVDPVVQYDLSPGAPALNLTPTGFSVRFEGKIRFKYSETYTMTLVHNDSGKLWINNLTTPIIDQASAGTHTGTFAATADQWYDIKMEWTNAASTSEFTLKWNSASQPIQVVPQDRLYPKAEAVPRFRSHVKFTQRSTFDEFLKSVLFTCNGAMQDVNGQLNFFCIDDLTPSFDFDESNIIKNTFKFYPRYSQQELLQLPNRFIADGRDLDSRYLQNFDPPLYYDVPELQDIAGRIIEETVVVGNTTRWQGLKNLAHYAKLKTAPLVCEFEGMPSTLQVLPGDLVTVTHSNADWVLKQFLCVEATDKSIDNSADERIFKLYEWE